MRGTTRRIDLKCSPGLSRLFSFLRKPFRPTQPPGSCAESRCCRTGFTSHLPEALSCRLTRLLPSLTFNFHFIFSLRTLAPFPLGAVHSLYAVLRLLRFKFRTPLSFASGPQVFSPYILMFFLFCYFKFLLFSLNNLCSRQGEQEQLHKEQLG